MAQDLPPYFEEKIPFLSRVALYKKEWLVSSIAFIAGAALLIAYFQSAPKPALYAQAEEAFAKWEAAPNNQDLYLEMKEALKKVPALEKKYAAPIAQQLLNGEKLKEAFLLAESSLEKLKGEAPLHAAYAEGSLLIEQGAYQQALEKAVSLKEKLAAQFDLSRLAVGEPLVGGSILYAQNLLRIAFLQKELGNKPGERAAWEEVEAFLHLEEGGPLADLILGNFHEKGVDLPQYIASRKKGLS